jgi:hypothetical protein
MTETTPGEARFWDLAEPCLRVHGAFFASCDRRSGDLLVKLPQQRVDELVAAGRVHAFAPAGRRFREWAAVPPEWSRTWRRLLDDALAFVDGST